MSDDARPRNPQRGSAIAASCLAVLLLLTGCATSTASASSETPAEHTAEAVELTDCLTINPTGPVTSAAAQPCLDHGEALLGFAEGAALMEFAEYRPGDAGEIATQIRLVADDLERSGASITTRVDALEAIAVIYDDTAEAWSLRAPGVTSSRGGDAAYIEVVTRDAWNTYFENFFEGPTAPADAAHVVERVFVRMRGFELN